MQNKGKGEKKCVQHIMNKNSFYFLTFSGTNAAKVSIFYEKRKYLFKK
jgi:hypothetical protein